MKKILFLAQHLIIIILASSVGCISFVYKTEDIRSGFAENESKLQQRTNEIEADYQKRQTIFKQLVSQLDKPNTQPYLALKKDLATMGANVQKMKAETNSYQKRRLAVEGSMGSEKTLPSSHPGIVAAKEFRDDSEEIVDRVKKIQENYTRAAKRYNETAQKGGIVNVKIADLMGQFASRELEVNKQIQAFRNSLNEAEKRNIATTTEHTDKRSDLLKKMNLKVDEIEQQSKSLFQMKERVLKEANGREEFATGPQLPSYSFVEDINAVTKVINQRGSELETLIRDYQSLKDR